MTSYKSAYDLELCDLDLQLCLDTDLNQADYDGSRWTGDEKPERVAAYQPTAQEEHASMSTHPLAAARFDDFVARVYDPARANDLHHDAIVKLLQKWEHFNPDHPGVAAYFRTTVRRLQVDQSRKPRLSRLPEGYDRASPEPPPDEAASFAEFRGRVRAALATLPDRERAVIFGKIAEKSVEETAAELSITVREVYALTFKARVKLRELLREKT